MVGHWFVLKKGQMIQFGWNSFQSEGTLTGLSHGNWKNGKWFYFRVTFWTSYAERGLSRSLPLLICCPCCFTSDEWFLAARLKGERPGTRDVNWEWRTTFSRLVRILLFLFHFKRCVDHWIVIAVNTASGLCRQVYFISTFVKNCIFADKAWVSDNGVHLNGGQRQNPILACLKG